MITALQPIRNLVKSRSVKKDNLVFRLHYQVTSVIFLAASGILVTNQFFGDPISCFNHGSHTMEEALQNTINNFCWVTSTFTVKEHLCARIGTEVPYAGIGILTPKNTPFNIQVTYRFMFFVLFLQGISFLLPYTLWRSWESDKMKMLSADLENPLLDDQLKSSRIHSLINYLLHGQVNGSIKYSFHLHFSEMMNLVVLGMNIWITDFLFRNEFIGYGIHAIANWIKNPIDNNLFDAQCDDPISSLFPQVAKCEWKHFGPSGNVQVIDNVCVLPLNDFNSFFFKFTWVWFAVLLFASVFWLLFRAVMFYSCKLRCLLLSRRAGSLPVNTSVHVHDGEGCCARICRAMSYADWVIIMQLGCNMDPLTFKIFLESLCHRIAIRENGIGKPAEIIGDKLYYSPV